MGYRRFLWADLNGAHTIHMPLARTRSHGHLNAGGWEIQSLHAQKEEGHVGPGKHPDHGVDNAQLARLQRVKSLTHVELEFKPRNPRRKNQQPRTRSPGLLWDDIL